MMTSERRPAGTAVRTVELSQPLGALDDLSSYRDVRVFVTWGGHLVGSVDIPNRGQPVAASRLRDAITQTQALKLLALSDGQSTDVAWTMAVSALSEHYAPAPGAAMAALPPLAPDLAVSIVVATHDRPDDLRACLRSLTAQQSPRRVEIIVVDNNPDSGLTPPVLAEFPGVLLMSERRKGASYARNAGFRAGSGAIFVTTDDDVTMPPDWLERLIAPFARPDVMLVTGNVLPAELETEAQRLFEIYGGLGRGFERLEFSGSWFEQFKRQAVPTWKLGATANAACRATIFSHPRIGMLEEALGPGTPGGPSEDIYLFYKVLKAGYTIIYEPQAYVWHRHRRDLAALRRQLYTYGVAHVSYHLLTLIRDGDLRAAVQLLLRLPLAHLWRISWRLRGWSSFPLSLILLEVRGNIVAPWKLWRSLRQARRQGRGEPSLTRR